MQQTPPNSSTSPTPRQRAPGAGRPRHPEPLARVTVTIPPKYLGKLLVLSGTSVSEGLRMVLEETWPDL